MCPVIFCDETTWPFFRGWHHMGVNKLMVMNNSTAGWSTGKKGVCLPRRVLLQTAALPEPPPSRSTMWCEKYYLLTAATARASSRQAVDAQQALTCALVCGEDQVQVADTTAAPASGRRPCCRLRSGFKTLRASLVRAAKPARLHYSSVSILPLPLRSR